MFNWIRGKVSLNKKRYQIDGYDLDLSYVGDKIIAMGYPASGFESTYRNDYEQVKKFLDSKHGKNYWVYNLCSERSYPSSFFEDRVTCFPFDDHNPPEFDMIRQFCVHAKNYLDEDSNRIVVVHCKAGKGRTGVMICALLIHMHVCSTAMSSLSLYGDQRTFDKKGVTIPSQRRYVYYYVDYLGTSPDLTIPYPKVGCRVTKIVFSKVPSKYFTRSLGIKITNMEKQPPLSIETHGKGGKPDKNHETVTLTYDLDGIMPLYTGDFRIAAVKGGSTVWYMWFNSTFIREGEDFDKTQIDKICKDKDFPNDFTMSVYCVKE